MSNKYLEKMAAMSKQDKKDAALVGGAIGAGGVIGAGAGRIAGKKSANNLIRRNIPLYTPRAVLHPFNIPRAVHPSYMEGVYRAAGKVKRRSIVGGTLAGSVAGAAGAYALKKTKDVEKKAEFMSNKYLEKMAEFTGRKGEIFDLPKNTKMETPKSITGSSSKRYAYNPLSDITESAGRVTRKSRRAARVAGVAAGGVAAGAGAYALKKKKDVEKKAEFMSNKYLEKIAAMSKEDKKYAATVAGSTVAGSALTPVAGAIVDSMHRNRLIDSLAKNKMYSKHSEGWSDHHRGRAIHAAKKLEKMDMTDQRRVAKGRIIPGAIAGIVAGNAASIYSQHKKKKDVEKKAEFMSNKYLEKIASLTEDELNAMITRQAIVNTARSAVIPFPIGPAVNYAFSPDTLADIRARTGGERERRPGDWQVPAGAGVIGGIVGGMAGNVVGDGVSSLSRGGRLGTAAEVAARIGLTIGGAVLGSREGMKYQLSDAIDRMHEND